MGLWTDGSRIVSASSPDRLAEIVGLGRDRSLLALDNREPIDILRNALGDPTVDALRHVLGPIFASLSPTLDISADFDRSPSAWSRLDESSILFLVDAKGERHPRAVEDWTKELGEGIVAVRRAVAIAGRSEIEEHWIITAEPGPKEAART